MGFRILTAKSCTIFDCMEHNCVTWTTESHFQLYQADGHVQLRKNPCEYMKLTCQQVNVQTGGESVIVWGMCKLHDMAPLIYLQTTVTSDKYVSIPSDHIHPFLSTVYYLYNFNRIKRFIRIATDWPRGHYSKFKHFH